MVADPELRLLLSSLLVPAAVDASAPQEVTLRNRNRAPDFSENASMHLFSVVVFPVPGAPQTYKDDPFDFVSDPASVTPRHGLITSSRKEWISFTCFSSREEVIDMEICTSSECRTLWQQRSFSSTVV